MNANSISEGDPGHHATRTPLASLGREAIGKGERHDKGATGRHKHERTTALVLMDREFVCLVIAGCRYVHVCVCVPVCVMYQSITNIILTTD